MGFGRYRFRRSFGNVASQFRGARPDTYPLFTGVLDDYPGAAAAYSLRALSSGWLAGDVVEVRRSSDSDTEGFTQGEIDSGAMLDWVNEDIIGYDSDFSTADGWTGSNGTYTFNESVGGESPVGKFMVDTSSSVRRMQKTLLSVGSTNRIQGEFYMPSTNDTITTIQVRDSTGGILTVLPVPTDDTWTSFDVSGVAASSTLQFRVVGGADAGGDDYFAVRNISVAVTAADGFDAAQDDQSGVTVRNATQATTTEQPKIVDAGAVVLDGNGNVSTLWDGIDDDLDVIAGFAGLTTANVYAITDNAGVVTRDTLTAQDISSATNLSTILTSLTYQKVTAVIIYPDATDQAGIEASLDETFGT